MPWQVRVDKPHAHISLTMGSSLNSTLPMVRARLTFKTEAMPEDLMFILYDTNYRLNWDKSTVAEFEEIDRPEEVVVCYYMRNKAPWPF